MGLLSVFVLFFIGAAGVAAVIVIASFAIRIAEEGVVGVKIAREIVAYKH